MLFNKLKWTRSFYAYAKHFLASEQSTLFLIQLTLTYIYATLRLFYLTYIRYYDFKPTHLYNRNYDPVLNFIIEHSEMYDAFITMLIWLFATFNYACQWALFVFDQDTVAWKCWYSFIVVNQDHYFSCLKTTGELEKIYADKEKSILEQWKIRKWLSQFGLSKAIIKLIAKVLVWFKLENIHQAAFFSRQPYIWPLSRKHRRFIILYLLSIDKFLLFGNIVYVILIVSFALIYAAQLNLHLHPYPAILWLELEFLIAINWLRHIFMIASFFTCCTILATIVYAGRIFEISRQLRQLIQRHYKLGYLPLEYYQTLREFLVTHNQIAYVVVTGSDQLFGQVMLAFLATNLPINIYIIRKNFLSTKWTQDLVYLWVAALIQISCTLAVFCPLAGSTAVYHTPKKFIPQLQMLLKNPRWMVMKLKFDDLLGRLLQGPKIAVGIGPLKEITFSSFLEFLVLYLGYLLIAFKSTRTDLSHNKYQIY